jgi:hypothetical protein
MVGKALIAAYCRSNYALLISVEHLPSAFLLTLKSTFAYLTNPALSSLTRISASYRSGQQQKHARALWEKAWDGQDGPVGVMRRAARQWGKRWEEAREEVDRREKEREREKKGKGGSGT